jgi:hypothetical protein
VALTPAIREFLDRLHELLEAQDRPTVAVERVDVTIAEGGTRVVVPPRDPAGYGIEIELHGREVRVVYKPEHQLFVDHHAEALDLVAAFLDGQIELSWNRVWIANVYRTYRDGRLVRTAWVPTLTLRSSTERRRYF